MESLNLSVAPFLLIGSKLCFLSSAQLLKFFRHHPGGRNRTEFAAILWVHHVGTNMCALLVSVTPVKTGTPVVGRATGGS
eukprot:1765854-Pleurochrysis_carterae.AAC.1